eukprot:NODE_9_length_64580_cov_1.431941.p5 type:complete len:820 gc:universal NODE_9_length_64580_cov_1.431941:3842-6301(+)
MQSTELRELLLRNQSGAGASILNDYIHNHSRDINFYRELLSIFQTQNDRVGNSAGLVLKNHIYNISDPAFIEFVVSELLKMPRDDRFRVGVIGTIIGKLCLHFPQIPISQHILELLINEPSIPIFNIISRICQEKPMDLQPVHFSVILQNLTEDGYALFAFEIINVSINSYNIDGFIPELIHALTIVPQLYRHQSLQLLAKIAESKSQILVQANFEATLKYVLENFDLDGAEFILSFIDNDSVRDALVPYLPGLVPLLLQGMQYTEEEVESTLEDSEIAPRHHLTQVHNQQEDSEDDDIDFYGEWNLRKCCASAIDSLSFCFKQQLTGIILPLLKDSFHSQNWLVREAGILALGAIADGCEHDLNPYLGELIPFLVTCGNDSHPLVSCIALWSMSRFALFISNSYDQDPGLFFEPCLQSILKGIVSQHLKVQEAGCSSLTYLCEQAGPSLSPYKADIMNAIVPCLSSYSKKNLIMLMDTLGALSFALGHDLREDVVMQAIIPPLLAYWDRVKIVDVVYPTLLDCLQHLFVAFGPLLLPFSKQIISKAGGTIIHGLADMQQHGLDSLYDATHIVCCLDLMSGLLNGLGEQSSDFFQYKENLNQILGSCLSFGEPEILQATFGLLGELTLFQPQSIDRFLPMYYEAAISAIHLPTYETEARAISNATWFLGELVIRSDGQIENIDVAIDKVVKLLILCSVQGNQQFDESKIINTSLTENATVTVARFALYHPDKVLAALNSSFEVFIKMLNLLHDTSEKMSAFSGLFAMVSLNSNIVATHLTRVLSEIANCKTNERDLFEIIKSVLFVNLDCSSHKAILQF